MVIARIKLAHFYNFFGSTSTGRGKLVARKLVAATWTRDNWTHATIGRDENWTRENNYKVEYSLRDASVESSIPTQGEKKRLYSIL
jgi:hypothetical protein